MTELRGRAVILSIPGGAGDRLLDDAAAIMGGIQDFADQLPRLTGEVAPATIHYPDNSAFRQVARMILLRPGFNRQTTHNVTRGVETGKPLDIASYRDAVYEQMARGIADGFQLFLTIPEVARVVLCGHTGISRTQAEDLLCSGVVAMGFSVRRLEAQNNHGARGKIIPGTPQIRRHMTSFSDDPRLLTIDDWL